MSVSSVKLEMQSPTHPLPTATSSDEEEDQRCWRDVEAETGFSSYASFLEALPITRPQFIDHLLANMSKDGFDCIFGEIQVLNILEDGGVSISMKVQGLYDDTVIPDSGRNLILDNDRKNCTQLLRLLRSPPENTLARIVVWSVPLDFSLHAGIVDAIGLGLKIKPAIFATLSSIVRQWNYPSSSRYTGSDYVVIGNSVATVVRNYRSNENFPPVLFVAKVREIDFAGFSRVRKGDCNNMVKEALTSEIHGSISLCYPASDIRSLKDLAPESSGYLDRLSNYVYLNILSKHFQKGAGIDAQNDGPLLNAILPLLHLEVLYLHTQCELTQRALLVAQRETSDLYKQQSYQVLDERRFGLRRMLEDLEKSKVRFVEFARLNTPAEWLEGQPWISQEEEIIETINDARAKEAEARDYMQLQIGNLSILESRKSIQLSSQQMREAKRGKSCGLPSRLMAC